MTAGRDLHGVQPCSVSLTKIAMAVHGTVITRSMCPSAPAHSPWQAPRLQEREFLAEELLCRDT